jgi:hypothetical protein
MVMDGGAGLQGIDCCGHLITAGAVHGLRFGQPLEEGAPMPTGPAGQA